MAADDEHQEQLRRRMRAGRVIAGMEKVDALAEAIDRKGLGRDTLYDMEGGRRRIQPHEVEIIAKGLGVSPAFFTVDFASLDEEDSSLGTRVDAIDRTLTRVEARLTALEHRDEQRDPEASPGTPGTGDRAGSRRRRAR